MRTINVKEILGSNLVSRLTAKDFLAFVMNTGEREVVLDFSGVEFASRSFTDEFYNCFHLNPERGFEFTMTNVPTDLASMLKAVESTQDGSGKSKGGHEDVYRPKDIDDLDACFSSLLI